VPPVAAIRGALDPTIQPALGAALQVDHGLRTEIELTDDAATQTVAPGAHDQPLIPPRVRPSPGTQATEITHHTGRIEIIPPASVKRGDIHGAVVSFHTVLGPIGIVGRMCQPLPEIVQAIARHFIHGQERQMAENLVPIGGLISLPCSPGHTGPPPEAKPS